MNVVTPVPQPTHIHTTVNNSTWIYIISIFLFFIIIILTICVVFLYTRPACIATGTLCDSYCATNCSTICSGNTNILIPYNIYGVNPVPCLTLDNSNRGIMVQTNGNGVLSNVLPGVLQLLPTSDINNPLGQWYLIPSSTPNKIIIQNVGSKGYININPTTSVITVQSGISNATSVYWQISKRYNTNYFVFVSPENNSCPIY